MAKSTKAASIFKANESQNIPAPPTPEEKNEVQSKVKKEEKKEINFIPIAIAIFLIIIIFLGCAITGALALFFGLQKAPSPQAPPALLPLQEIQNYSSLSGYQIGYPEGWQEASISDLEQENSQAAQIAAIVQSSGADVLVLMDDNSPDFAMATSTDKLPQISSFMCNPTALGFAASQFGEDSGMQIVSASWHTRGENEGCEIGIKANYTSDTMHLIASSACPGNQTAIIGGNSAPALEQIFASLQCP